LTLRSNTTQGLGEGEIPTYYENVVIRIGDSLRVHVYAGFTSGLENVGMGLLGQEGFFSRFVVQFDHAKDEFHIDVPEDSSALIL
jgi:hypothetical protein